jgi:hypothetical protein
MCDRLHIKSAVSVRVYLTSSQCLGWLIEQGNLTGSVRVYLADSVRVYLVGGVRV